MPELGSSSCLVFSGQAKELNSYGKVLPPIAALQGCCLDCLMHNYTLSKVGSLQMNCLAWKGEKLLPRADLIRLVKADGITFFHFAHPTFSSFLTTAHASLYTIKQA